MAYCLNRNGDASYYEVAHKRLLYPERDMKDYEQGILSAVDEYEKALVTALGAKKFGMAKHALFGLARARAFVGDRQELAEELEWRRKIPESGDVELDLLDFFLF